MAHSPSAGAIVPKEAEVAGGGGISDTALVCSLLDSVTGPRPIGPLGRSLLWDPSEGQHPGLGCDPPCPDFFLPLHFQLDVRGAALRQLRWQEGCCRGPPCSVHRAVCWGL